jgi:hypothetical protein
MKSLIIIMIGAITVPTSMWVDTRFTSNIDLSTFGAATFALTVVWLITFLRSSSQTHEITGMLSQSWPSSSWAGPDWAGSVL